MAGWISNSGSNSGRRRLRDLDASSFKARVHDLAGKSYADREVEYPVMAGLYRFSKADGNGGRRIDRDELAEWARQRFHVNIDVEDFRSKQKDDIHAVLVEKSRILQRQADEAVAEVKRRVEELPSLDPGHPLGAEVGNGKLASLTDWLRRTVNYNKSADELAKLGREKLEQALTQAVENHYRPEIRRMERMLVLQILDAAWKDHLLAMDHLRSSVSLRGYAQVDPKVEYKREGMRLFDSMWIQIGERVTDLVFRMEQLDEGFVGSTWAQATAVHEEATSSYGVSEQQRSA